MPALCYFASFLFVLETRFINKPESSKDYFHNIFNFLFEIVSVFVTEPRFIFEFLHLLLLMMLLANCVSTSFLKMVNQEVQLAYQEVHLISLFSKFAFLIIIYQ